MGPFLKTAGYGVRRNIATHDATIPTKRFDRKNIIQISYSLFYRTNIHKTITIQQQQQFKTMFKFLLFFLTIQSVSGFSFTNLLCKLLVYSNPLFHTLVEFFSDVLSFCRSCSCVPPRASLSSTTVWSWNQSSPMSWKL